MFRQQSDTFFERRSVFRRSFPTHFHQLVSVIYQQLVGSGKLEHIHLIAAVFWTWIAISTFDKVSDFRFMEIWVWKSTQTEDLVETDSKRPDVGLLSEHQIVACLQGTPSHRKVQFLVDVGSEIEKKNI